MSTYLRNPGAQSGVDLDPGRLYSGGSRRSVLALAATSVLAGSGVAHRQAAPERVPPPSSLLVPEEAMARGTLPSAVRAAPVRTWLSGYAGDNSSGGRSSWTKTFYRPQVSSTYMDYETTWSQRAADIGLNRGNFLPSVSDGSAINVLTIGLTLAGRGGSKKMNNAGLAAAADGSDTSFAPGFTGIGRALRAAGLNSPSTVIRLGHEMDGNWFPWSTNRVPRVAAHYVRAWRRAHRAITAVCPRVRFCECWAIGGSATLLNLHYVGDSFVDIISTDFYDFGEGKTPADITAAQDGIGIDAFGAFAHAHGKKFSLDEWAVNGQDHRAVVRDSPVFVKWVYDQLSNLEKSYPGVVSHDSYFNEQPFYLFAKNPHAAATYRALWRR